MPEFHYVYPSNPSLIPPMETSTDIYSLGVLDTPHPAAKVFEFVLSILGGILALVGVGRIASERQCVPAGSCKQTCKTKSLK